MEELMKMFIGFVISIPLLIVLYKYTAARTVEEEEFYSILVEEQLKLSKKMVTNEIDKVVKFVKDRTLVIEGGSRHKRQIQHIFSDKIQYTDKYKIHVVDNNIDMPLTHEIRDIIVRHMYLVVRHIDVDVRIEDIGSSSILVTGYLSTMSPEEFLWTVVGYLTKTYNIKMEIHQC